MQNTSKLLRAITAVFVKRVLKRVAMVASVMAVLILVAVGLLAAKIDGAWAAAYIVVVPLFVAAFTVGILVWLAVSWFQPRKLTRREAKDIYDFTSKIIDIVGRAKMPWPFLVGSAIKSVLLGRESNELGNLINGSKQLREDFIHLRDSMA